MQKNNLLLFSIFLLCSCSVKPTEPTHDNFYYEITSSIYLPGLNGGVIMESGKCEALLNGKQYERRSCYNSELSAFYFSKGLHSGSFKYPIPHCQGEFLRVKVDDDFLSYGENCYSIGDSHGQMSKEDTQALKVLGAAIRKEAQEGALIRQ